MKVLEGAQSLNRSILHFNSEKVIDDDVIMKGPVIGICAFAGFFSLYLYRCVWQGNKKSLMHCF